MKRRTILIAAGAVVLVIAIVCIVFSIPFTEVPVYTVETYQETTTEQEQYTDTEEHISKEMVEKTAMLYNGSPYSVPHGISVPFTVNQTGTRLVGSYRLPAAGGFYLYSVTGKILYEKLGSHGEVDIALGKGEYRALVRERTSWEEQIDLTLKLKWNALEEVTEYEEVTKYRDVPHTVEKQRTVTSYEKVSIWNIIFGRK